MMAECPNCNAPCVTSQDEDNEGTLYTTYYYSTAETVAMQREIEWLRAALKPFAEANIERVTGNDDRTASALGVTFGDFRRAHDVLYPPSVK